MASGTSPLPTGATTSASNTTAVAAKITTMNMAGATTKTQVDLTVSSGDNDTNDTNHVQNYNTQEHSRNSRSRDVTQTSNSDVGVDSDADDHDSTATANDNDNNNNNSITSKNDVGSTGLTKNFKRFGLLLLFLMLFPIFPLAISTIFGALLAWAENVPFLEGFLYVASNLLAMSTPLTDFNPNDAIGVLIDVYVSIMALLTFGIVLNLVNLFQVPISINQQIQRYVTKNKILIPCLALIFIIPFWVSFLAVVFGSILGAIEGWTVKDGILYVFSNLLGLGTPLTDVLPTTVGGDLVDIVISSMALGCVAIFVDYVTVLNPARYLRKRFKERLEVWGVARLDENRSMHPLAYSPSIYSPANDNMSESHPDSSRDSGGGLQDGIGEDEQETNKTDFIQDQHHAGFSQQASKR